MNIRFRRFKEINVTNKFPTEEAPFGLNYYVPMKELPYPADYRHAWNNFLFEVQGVAETMTGRKTTPVFGSEWLGLDYINEADRDRLVTLGYNPICTFPGTGPVVWGNSLQGSNWYLPHLNVVMDVIEDIQWELMNLIRVRQLSLFPELDFQINITKATVHAIINNHRAQQNLYCRDLSDPVAWSTVEGRGWRLDVPLHPHMQLHPMILRIRYDWRDDKFSYFLDKEFLPEYKMIDHLWGLPDDLHLEL